MHYVRIFGLALPLVLAGPTIGAPKEPQTSNDAANGARSADPLTKQYGLKVFDQVLGSAREPAIIMSPYSLTSALDMLALGADGATARLFRQQGITRPRQAGQDTYRSLTTGSNAGPTLRIANSAWLRPHAKPRPRFVKAIRRSYDASITTLDFSRPDAASKINAWVNSATQEMIPQVVDSIDPTTQFALINTVYFKGKWVTPFAKADTKASAFTRLDGTKHNVPMMNATRSVSYAELPNWHAIALPYGGERFQMVVVTSKEATKAAEFKQEAAKIEFLQALGQLKMQEVEVAVKLPRFKAEYGADLTPTLSNMGLKRAFGSGANYRHITAGRVRAVAVIHRAVVDVSEEGTEAAASTAVVATRGLRERPPPVKFSADRPFFFAITDKVTGTALFVGYVADPGA